MNINREFDKAEANRSLGAFQVLYPKRILFNIVSTFVWIGFNLIWIAFLWSSFSFFQNIVLLGIAFMVFSALNALVCLIVRE